jgi:hypothetical protein
VKSEICGKLMPRSLDCMKSIRMWVSRIVVHALERLLPIRIELLEIISDT